MTEHKGQNYLHGAAILTAGVIIMKILGFIYKMPIGNILGDDGYSMFLHSYNVYNVFLTLSTAGLPIALARMVSEANAQGRVNQLRRTFSVAWRTFFWMGLFCSLIMALFPHQIADYILRNPDAALSIRVMSPSVLLVCLVSAYRGYCQGFGDMIPTTVGQVLEVLVKVVVGLALAWFLMHESYGKPLGAAGAIFGVTAGSAAALLYMWLHKRRHYRDDAAGTDTPDPDRAILRRFLRIGIPIALGGSVLALLNLIDASLCMGRLQDAARFSYQEAKELTGVYGKAQTIFNLPAAIITPLTISVVPAITAAIVKRENDEATKISEDSMRIAAVLSLPMGVGLSVLARPIMNLIYPDANPVGVDLLALLGVASVFVCIVLMENAILQATGHELLPMITMIVGGLAKVVINFFLVADRGINIYGAPIGTLASYVLMAVMNFVIMCFVLDKNPRLRVILLKPALCTAAMGATAWMLFSLLARFMPGGRLGLSAALFPAILAAAAVYLVLSILLRTVTKEDMSLIPGGAKLARLLRMR
ncbi:MAG: polysaccharide biosynthesis protein [Oscillospiraceae bacterium]|nr:polysaccharide biosynthesis protein [Oscillospiraceae bacterium]